MTPRVEFTPGQLEQLAALVAQRIAATLTSPHADVALIDAAEVARRHGVTRSWVYDHADRLGAIRLGNGSRPRLRFNPETAAAQLAAEPEPEPLPLSPSPRRRRRHTTHTGAPLLPIGSRRTA